MNIREIVLFTRATPGSSLVRYIKGFACDSLLFKVTFLIDYVVPERK